MDTIQLVRRAIVRMEMLSAGETLVVGVSGGPDSLCLLHVLRQLAPERQLRLHVGHLHHGLRGDDAEADAQFVNETATRWGLPCTVRRVDVPSLAAHPGISLEEAARNARYAFLRALAAQVGAHIVAVGHNADDQAETVLMHWLRGSGLAGLRGMTPVSDLAGYRLGEQRTEDRGQRAKSGGPDTRGRDESGGLRLIRPLLGLSRTEILAYCDAHGLRPRYDRSNEDTTYFRNRLRHELLPLLETYNPQIRAVLCRSATVLADDYRVLHQHLAECWPEITVEESPDRLVFHLAAWRALPASLQRATLRQAISRLRLSLRNIDFVPVENGLWALREGDTGTRMTLPAGLELVLGYSRFAVGNQGVELPAGDVPRLAGGPVAVAVPGTTFLGDSNWRLSTRLIVRAGLPAGWDSNPDPWQAWLDARVVGATPILRTRRAGDRFQPLGMGGHAKLLAELFTNAKILPATRDHWPLLATARGEIAWVCGLRVDERAKVTQDTAQVLHVKLAIEAHESENG